MDYGYIRVSTKEQNEDRQLVAMKEYGIEKSRLFIDKQSGKDFIRPAYRRMIKRLRENDTIVIKSIDRLGRDYHEIIEQWRVITKEKRINIVVLDMPLLDTRQKGQSLTGTFISDLVLQILSYVAQTERENIRNRQAEGIAVAKAQGKHMGRPRINKPLNYENICRQYLSKEFTSQNAAILLGVSKTTFLRWVKEENAKKL